MTLHEKSITVDIAPDRLFAYLSDIENLPRYLPQMTSAEAVDGGNAIKTTARIDPGGDGTSGPQEVEGEAWLDVTEAERSLSWGSKGPNDYHGELQVHPGDADDISTLTVRLNTERAENDDTERAENDDVERGLVETLEGIKRNVEADDDSSSS